MFLNKMPNSVPMISAMMRLIASTMIDLTSEKETHDVDDKEDDILLESLFIKLTMNDSDIPETPAAEAVL